MHLAEESGLALQEGTGNYGCFATADCSDQQLTDVAAIPNGPCTAGKTCCIPKTSSGTGTRSTSAPETAKRLPDPLGGVNIPTFIGNVIRTFAGIAGTIALCMFVYGGIMLIMSGGEQAKVTNGRKILINASIGLLLIFSAYTFVTAIIGAILAE